MDNETLTTGNGSMWIFALLILLLIGGGNGLLGGAKTTGTSDFSQYATSASQNEILLGQKFDNIGQKVNQIGDGICSSTYALNNEINAVQTTLGGAITNEGRNIQSQLSALNSNIDNKFAALEKSQLEQRIAEQAQQISQLQMAQMLCGIPKTNPYGYGIVPTFNGVYSSNV